ncbi:TolC family outer membrane protein [Rhodophyticola porphyridii]|nr:TolC family outer membrane protein [Rhodophyticola porphyridii]
MTRSFSTLAAALAIALTVGGMSGAAKADTLRAALGDAYENSDLLEQSRFLARLQDEGVAQQISALRPIVNFIANSTWNSVTDTTVNSLTLVGELLVYDNGGRQRLVEAARESVLSARQGLINLEQQVLLDAVTAYMNVWRDIQVVQVRESNVRVLTQQLRAARDRFEVGEDTRTDVAQAEAQLAAARSNLAAARGQLEISQELFVLAVGRPSEGLIGPGALPDLPDTEAEADRLARQQHPLILGLQHEVRADELSLAAARTDYGPSVSLRAETGEAFGDRSNGVTNTLSLTLTQPIYRGGQLFSLERSAIATLNATEAELHQQVRLIVQSVGNAYARLRIANAQIQASDQQIRAAQLAFDGVREEASLGARTTLDVLDAEQDLLDARISRIEAQADLYVGAYAALASVGLLTVEHLNLDVPQYDPTAYSNAFGNAPTRSVSVRGQRLDGVLERIGRD